MHKFHIYILKMFVKYLILVDLFVSLMSMITSVLGDSKGLREHSYTIFQFLELQAYSVALSHNLAMPISSSVTTIIVILLLMRSNEMLAYVTLGGKLRSLMVPFLIAGASVAVFMLWWEYKIIPEARIGREQMLAEIKKEPYVKYSQYDNLWLIDNDTGIVNIKVVDMFSAEVIGITEYFLDDNSTVSTITSIDHAKREGDKWLITNKQVAEVTVNPPVVTHIESEYIQNALWDDLVRVAITDIRSLSPAQLSAISSIMETRGLNVSKYDMLFFQKFANAISVIVLLMCTFPIAVNFSRNYSLVKNASMMLVLGVVYWVLQSVTLSLGQTGTLTPFLANFLPIIVFSFLSVYIVYQREKVR